MFVKNKTIRIFWIQKETVVFHLNIYKSSGGMNSRKQRETSGDGPERVDARLDALEALVRSIAQPQPQQRFMVSAEVVPEFEPGMANMNASKWIQKIEQLAEIYGWDEKMKITCMQARLKGLAKAWHDNLPNYIMSWVEWKHLLVQAFPDPQDFASHLKTFVNRVMQPNEGISE